MSTTQTPLDYSVHPFPNEIGHTFEHEVGSDLFLYSVTATDFKWDRDVSIDGRVFIRKYQQSKRRTILSLFRLRLFWQRIWSFSTEYHRELITRTGESSHLVRQTLEEKALNRGVLLTELLLEELMVPIVEELRKLQITVQQLRRAGGVTPITRIA